MLTKESIILAQMIAASLGDYEIKPSGILDGLNEVSYGSFPFSSTDYVNQLVDLTTNITPHTDVMDMATTEMANIIRGAFDMVKTYGYPLASCIADSVGLLYNEDSVMRIIRREANIKYLSVDDPLFNLSIFPREVKNKALSYASVNFEMLKRLRFDYINEDDLIEWIGSNHPEIAAIVKDKVSSFDSARYFLTDYPAMTEVFKASGENMIDFTEIRSVDISLLLKMWLIVSKMFMSEEPVKWLTEGSSEDYRSFVNLMYHGITTYLVKLQDVIKVYRARQITVISDKPVRFVEITPNEALGVKVNVVQGDLVVYYTDEVMRALTSRALAIGDVVLADCFANCSGKNVGILNLINSPDRTNALLREYLLSVSERISRSANEYFVESAIKAITTFIDEKPAVRDALYAALGDKSKMVGSIIREKLIVPIRQIYGHYNRNLKDDGGDCIAVDSPIIDERKKHCIDMILSTELIPCFLQLLGCDLAAEIIRNTYCTQERAYTAVEEREKLHEALIITMAGKLVG